MRNIFITIPAYKDPNLVKTIEDAINLSKYPNRLHFAIALMYDELPDGLDKYFNNINFQFVRYDIDARPGVNRIRKNLLDLHNGEEFYLQIDAHMSFMQNWDVILENDFDDLRLRHGDKVMISRPLYEHVGYVEDDGINEEVRWGIEFHHPDNLFRLLGISCNRDSLWSGERFKKTTCASAHFMFTSNKFIEEVGITDQQIYCEELLLSKRMYDLGWTIWFNPCILPIGHLYRTGNVMIFGKEHLNKRLIKDAYGPEDSKEVMKDINSFILTGKSNMFGNEIRPSTRQFFADNNLEYEWQVLLDVNGLEYNA